MKVPKSNKNNLPEILIYEIHQSDRITYREILENLKYWKCKFGNIKRTLNYLQDRGYIFFDSGKYYPYDPGNIFATGESLQTAIDQGDPEIEDFLDQVFENLYEIDFREYFQIPYWIEFGVIDVYSDYSLENIGPEDVLCEYRSGIYEPLNYGDTVEISGKQYTYIYSQPLSEEIEHQAENGELVYEYRGYSFFRIFAPSELL